MLHDAVTRRLYGGSLVTGKIILPAIPAMLDEYVHLCATLFGAVGRPFSEDQLEHVKVALNGQLAEAVSASPRSTIVISYNAPQSRGLNYLINAQWPIVAGAYEKWTASREPRQFGSDPNARVEPDAIRRMYRGSVVTGEITIPAVPAMLDEYLHLCATLFGAVGRPFTKDQLQHLKDALKRQLTEAFSASPRSMIVISYNAPSGGGLNYHINAQWFTVAGAYENWTATREPPLFGSEPDARVMALADEAEDRSSYPILDIGAGTGRNALALARLGHPVDAVEMTPAFATDIRTEAQRDSLNVRVIERDVFTTIDDLRRDYQLILLSEVVCDFRTTQQLRGLFELATQCLPPGGLLLFNAFVAHRDYVPDDAARQLGQQSYTGFFTQDEFAGASAALPLQLISDVPAYDYEKANLPADAWPPTGWYEKWASGLDLFDLPRERCPIELRWLVYRRTGPTESPLPDHTP